MADQESVPRIQSENLAQQMKKDVASIADSPNESCPPPQQTTVTAAEFCPPPQETKVLNRFPIKLRRPRNEIQFPQTKWKRTGHWTPQENAKYFEFLSKYRTNFEKQELRRLDKIFKMMSEQLGSRAADQCRSHHQKMQKKFGTLDGILQSQADSTKLPQTPSTQPDRLPVGPPAEDRHWDGSFFQDLYFSKEPLVVVTDIKLTVGETEVVQTVHHPVTLTEEFEEGLRNGFLTM